MPLPPFWLRSSPLPTLIAAGDSVAYHSAKRAMSAASSPHVSAARASVHGRASAMYSSKPATQRSMNARSSAPRRSSSAASAQPSTTSVPGRSGRCRSACSAILMRRGSTTTSLPPARRTRWISGVMCRFDQVTLLPQATTSRACAICSGRMPAAVPKVPSHASVRMPPHSGPRSSSVAPMRWKKRRSIEPPASRPWGPA